MYYPSRFVYPMGMEAMLYPWSPAATCSRCNGPWGQNCVDGKAKCRAVHIFWDNHYECACCRAVVTTAGPMPKPWLDDAWAKIQREHLSTCRWAQTRGYLVRIEPHPLPRAV